MSKAYIKGTIKKVFDLKSGEGKRGPWTRLDMVVTKEDGSEQLEAEPIVKVWGGDTLQVYEGASIEAHGKIDEYGGQVRIVADAKDVTINGGAAPTPEQAKEIMTSSSPARYLASRKIEIDTLLLPKYIELGMTPEAAAALVNTQWIGITSGKVEDDLPSLEDEGGDLPF
jgi:hypothetical protein